MVYDILLSSDKWANTTWRKKACHGLYEGTRMPLSAAFSLALSVLWLYATQETSSGHSFPRTSYMKCLSIARNQRETFALGTSPPKERRRIRQEYFSFARWVYWEEHSSLISSVTAAEHSEISTLAYERNQKPSINWLGRQELLTLTATSAHGLWLSQFGLL